MKRKENAPSRIALAFFHWFCQPELREEIEGDLMERFTACSEKYGHAKANRLFIRDVLLLFRPAIIGNIYQLTHTETMVITKQHKQLIALLGGALVLLLIPLVAMGFTTEVDWTVFDFIVAGVLLIGTALAINFVLKKAKTRRNKMILVATVCALILLLWAELAVGIFESPIAGS